MGSSLATQEVEGELKALKSVISPLDVTLSLALVFLPSLYNCIAFIYSLRAAVSSLPSLLYFFFPFPFVLPSLPFFQFLPSLLTMISAFFTAIFYSFLFCLSWFISSFPSILPFFLLALPLSLLQSDTCTHADP